MTFAWCRLYGEMVDDAKLRLLAFEDRWHYVALLCCKTQGVLDHTKPGMLDRVVAAKLGLATRDADEVRRRLVDVDLIDERWQPLGWERRQYRSDSSTPRTRKLRALRKEESDTDTDTDTEGERSMERSPNVLETFPPKKSAKRRAEHPSIGIPPGVNHDALKRWEVWLGSKGKPVNDIARPAIARVLAAIGDHEAQAAAVEHSIARQWVSLRPPRDESAVPLPFAAARTGRALPKTADQLEEEASRAIR